MFASFSPFPNFAQSSSLEVLIWTVAMGFAILFGVGFLATFLRESRSPHEQSFRRTMFLLVSITLAMVGMRVASQGQAASSNAPSARPETPRCPNIGHDPYRCAP